MPFHFEAALHRICTGRESRNHYPVAGSHGGGANPGGHFVL
jgi:hypothetical protein